MSKKAVIRVVAIYFGIAAAFAVILLLAKSGTADLRTSVIIGSFVGIALLAPILAGVLPLIFWAFGRFSADKAAGPIVVWVLLGTPLFLFSTLEDVYEGNLAINNIPTNISAFFTNDHDTFVRVVRSSCEENQRKNLTPGITRQQATEFCSCYADVLASELTPRELSVALSSQGAMSPWFRSKIFQASPPCRKRAFGTD